ncbi:MAG TPA: hypothetical protein VHC70_00160 [Phycisphaerales bacterium]|nr:hypothetical protein [Phycisphaerales bacterium]
MHTDSARSAATTDYPALLAQLRIAALRALADIMATSDDPTEKRLAATAILRAPEPEEPRTTRRPSTDQPRRTAGAQGHSESQAEPIPPADREAARELLTQAGIPIENDDIDAALERLCNMPALAVAQLLARAGAAAPSDSTAAGRPHSILDPPLTAA